MNRLKGFTLVELVVVIATIGILATITVIGLTRYQADTRDARRAASANIIGEALEKYYDQNGEYPSCSAVTASATTVTSSTLKGVSASSLKAPQASSGTTNSLNCTDTLTVDGTDFFQYVGDGSPACSGSGACLSYSIKYKDEASGTIKTADSRRNTSIATSGAPTASIGDIDFDNITVNWTDVANASSYLIQRSTSASFTSPTEATATSGTLSKVMDGLSINTLYYFRVRPNATASTGTWSNTISATTLAIAKPICNAVSNSNSQITTSWNSVANATSYNFRYSTSSSMTSPIVTNGLSNATLNQVITGLSTGVTYYFQVMAVNSGGGVDSGWSLVCQATTFVPVPQNIAAVTDSSTQITVSWDTVSVANSYTVEYSLSNTFTSPTSVTGITGTSQAITGLPQGKTHYFRVYALVGAVPSAASATASATTTVNTPSTPSAAAYTPGSTRPYSAGDWVAFTGSPQSGNWYYSYGTGSVSCPSGTTKQYSFLAQYSSPTTQYGWTSFSSDTTRYMIRPNSPYKVKFYVRARCAGTNATSGVSGYDTACASNGSSNVACF